MGAEDRVKRPRRKVAGSGKNWQWKRDKAQEAVQKRQRDLERFIDENPPEYLLPGESPEEDRENLERFGEYADFMSQPGLEEMIQFDKEEIGFPYSLPEPILDPKFVASEFDRDSQEYVDPNTDIETLHIRLDSQRGRISKLLQEAVQLRNKVAALSGATRTASKRILGNLRIEEGRRVEGRLPPCSIELEQAVLGAYLVHPEWMNGFNQPYLQKMFYDLRHSELHKGMMNFVGMWDLNMMSHFLKQRGTLDMMGGSSYLQTLGQIGESIKEKDTIFGYIDALEGLAKRRELIVLASTTIHELFDNEILDGDKKGQIVDVPGYVRDLTQKVLEVLPLSCRTNDAISTVVAQELRLFEELAARGGKPKISTGYPSLDRITHGIRGKRLVVVGARTKMGKTTFNVNLAYNLAMQNHGSLIFSLDTSSGEYVQKLISRDAEVDSEAFYWFREDDKDTPRKIIDAGERVRKMPIWFSSARPDIESMVGTCRQYKMLHPEIQLIVLDGMQSFARYIQYRGRKEDIYYENLQRLKEVASELDVMVIVNSQLKEQAAKHKGRRPNSVEDFPDTQGLSELASAAMVLYRPEEYWPEDPAFRGWLEVIPVALRVGSKAGKTCRLGINMPNSKIFELPLVGEDYQI